MFYVFKVSNNCHILSNIQGIVSDKSDRTSILLAYFGNDNWIIMYENLTVTQALD